MAYQVTKTYGHEQGLTAVFRQWRAESHCRFLHGYALSISITFEADELDERNWVIDFGSLKPLKELLTGMFDHKTVVARDDPKVDAMVALAEAGLIDLVFVKHTGCEAFAELIFDYVADWLRRSRHSPRVRLVKVTVREHGANEASYYG